MMIGASTPLSDHDQEIIAFEVRQQLRVNSSIVTFDWLPEQETYQLKWIESGKELSYPPEQAKNSKTQRAFLSILTLARGSLFERLFRLRKITYVDNVNHKVYSTSHAVLERLQNLKLSLGKKLQCEVSTLHQSNSLLISEVMSYTFIYPK